MAELTRTALTRLLPDGLAWRLTGQSAQVIDGLADSVEEALLFCGAALDEAIPSTATDTIADWYDALGLTLDQSQTLAQQRLAIAVAHTSIGGSSLDYLHGRVSMQFPLVAVRELPDGSQFGFTYEIYGNVDTINDFRRLQGLVQRIFPLHLEPQYAVIIISTVDTAYTGIATCGRAITGRITA